MTDNIRNPGVYWVRLLMYTLLSIMIGGVFFDMGNGQSEVTDRAGLLFYVAAFMVFMSIAVVPTFISERSVFLRERNNGWYSEGPYALAGFICGIPGVFLLALVASVIVCQMTGISADGSRFGWFLLDLFLSLLVAESFMTVISAVAPFYIIGMAFGSAVYRMFMVTEGFIQACDAVTLGPAFTCDDFLKFCVLCFLVFADGWIDSAASKHSGLVHLVVLHRIPHVFV